MNYNKTKSLDILIEVYKLYTAFCAILIAGLLAFVSSLSNINLVYYFYVSIGALSLASVCCILGIQYFITKIHKNKYYLYSCFVRVITLIIMVLILLGLILGFLFLINQDKFNKNQNKVKKIEHNILQLDINTEKIDISLKINKSNK